MARRVAFAWLLLLTSWGLALGAQRPVPVHYFWAENCSHCARARPQLEALLARYPAAQLHSYEIWQDRAHFELLSLLVERAGQGPPATPTLAIGDRLWVGLGPAAFAEAEATLQRCLAEGCPDPLAGVRQVPAAVPGPAPAPPAPPPPPAAVTLPGFGSFDPQGASLPLLTVVLGLLDSFNPCAFFVLFFLLSLMLHAHSRRTMWLVGGTFVLCSGLVYFLFMAAWLNLFLLVGQLRGVTLAAGLLALLVALINIKDFFWFRAGVTLSIPEQAKPGLFARMRALLRANSIAPVLAGTLVLALAANSYELLCTAGFPMVYTRILTLHELAGWRYYAWLGLYNLIYILPLFVIVAIFAITLGRRTMSEWQGRVLKLLSGVMMLLLGLALLLRPALLGDPWSAAALLPAAGLICGALLGIEHWRRRRSAAG